MTEQIQLLDVVALCVDKPEQGLRRRQVGTVVNLRAKMFPKSSSPIMKASHTPSPLWLPRN